MDERDFDGTQGTEISIQVPAPTTGGPRPRMYLSLFTSQSIGRRGVYDEFSHRPGKLEAGAPSLFLRARQRSRHPATATFACAPPGAT